ncbi:hypothetical protein [Frankia nepalensis]|uniref:Uncharacterized protein n=1 Tax=Frankia nepalensis TaxID=1836974 RepID=A0A937RGH1_9ACTN|nr:hypothetical protein [Frankia nepalensis]MBL7494797.1 hypothetical protein [Frankia nepalensis]MBL7514329.1 hypothetical protein [Frankia nepalensis]MBL7631743.1 hypothetical protein [Frankia nepalensis]
MTFEAWLDRLRTDGYLLCPASSAVPVELRAVRPDGWGVHLRCRGVHVRLGLYRPGRSVWQVPLWDREVVPEDALELWEHQPPPSAAGLLPVGTRIAFTGAADAPDHQAVFDGATERGWRGHEAGLLSPADAAKIFGTLLAATEPELARWRRPAPALGGAAAPAAAPATGTVPAARTGAAPRRPALAGFATEHPH